MKKNILLFIPGVLAFANVHAQSDTIYLKSGQQLFCTITKETTQQYFFKYTDESTQMTKSAILKMFVDSVARQQKSLATRKQQKKVNSVSETSPTSGKDHYWKENSVLGLGLSNTMDFNNPYSPDKKSLSANLTLDLSAAYRKPSSALQMTHELHYILSLQKESLNSGTHIQVIQDNVATLHDVAMRLGAKSKWHLNVIGKLNTSVFTVFDGNYFKNYTGLNKIQGFLSPYKLNIAPGIKYQPTPSLGISISPYSFEIAGVKDPVIRAKGLYITDLDASGNYKKNVFKRLGAELNIWYDKSIKEWLQMQYRIGVSSDYIENVGRNGQLDGLFITRVRIIKNIYLTHRATLQNNLAGNFWKPHYNQVFLLSYNKVL